jgi:hypothetical protein
VKRYITARVAQALLVLWAAYTITFVVLYLLPGDPVAIMLSANNVELDSLTPAQIEAAQARLGLDRPVYEQYATLLLDAVRGDFGTSFAKGVPATELVVSRLPGTVVLSGVAVVVSLAAGGVVEHVAERLKNSGVLFGFGGVAPVGCGAVGMGGSCRPPEYVGPAGVGDGRADVAESQEAGEEAERDEGAPHCVDGEDNGPGLIGDPEADRDAVHQKDRRGDGAGGGDWAE